MPYLTLENYGGVTHEQPSYGVHDRVTMTLIPKMGKQH